MYIGLGSEFVWFKALRPNLRVSSGSLEWWTLEMANPNRMKYSWVPWVPKIIIGMRSIIIKPNTQRRRDSTVESVASWPSLHYFLHCWAIEVGDKWRHNGVIVEKVTTIDQYSLWSLLGQFPNCRPIPSAVDMRYCEFYIHAADATQVDSWVELRREVLFWPQTSLLKYEVEATTIQHRREFNSDQSLAVVHVS